MGKYCAECGNLRKGTGKFCAECGKPFADETVSQSKPDFNVYIKEFFVGIDKEFNGSRADVHRSFLKAFNSYSEAVTGKSLFERFKIDEFGFDFDQNSSIFDQDFGNCINMLIRSEQINETQIPALASCIDYTLNRVASGNSLLMKKLNDSIGYEGWHLLNVGMLFDFENDQNLLTFFDAKKAEDHINFYKKMFPQGIDEFIYALDEARSLVVSEEIILFEKKQNRTKYWDTMTNYYQNHLRPPSASVGEVIADVDWLKVVLAYLNQNASEVLAEPFISLIQCIEGDEGPSQVLIFTEASITQVCVKEKDLRKRGAVIQKRENIREISVGSHTNKIEGIGSITQFDWILTIQTHDHKEYIKTVYMGKNEKELNESRPKLMTKLESIGKFYEIVDGEDLSTTTTMRLTPSIGIWKPL